MNEQHTPLPDEDRLDLPASWTGAALRSRPSRVSAAAIERWRARVVERRARIDLAIENPENAEYAPAMRAYLDGEPNPRGAAAIATVIHDLSRRETIDTIMVDAWETEHGLPFAAAALVEEAGLWFDEHHPFWPSPRGREGTGLLKTHTMGGSVGDRSFKITERLRAAIGALDPDAYEAARALVAEHAMHHAHVQRAAMLFPLEDDWVIRACSGYTQCNNATDGGIWPLVRTPEQLRELGGLALYPRAVTARRLGSLMASLGNPSLAAFAATWHNDWELNADKRRTLAAAIAMLPSDEAMEFLLRRLGEPQIGEAAVVAVNRFPRRALRVAARIGTDRSADHSLLAAVIEEIRLDRFEAAIAGSDPRTRADLGGLLHCPEGLPAAPLSALPAVLVEPRCEEAQPHFAWPVVSGLRVEDPTEMVWAAGEREAIDDRVARKRENRRLRWDLIADSLRSGGSGNLWPMLAFGPREIADPFVDRLHLDLKPYELRELGEYLEPILERYGIAVADLVVEFVRSRSAYHRMLDPIRSLEAARLAAHWYLRIDSARASGAAWLDRHREAACRLLVPDAVGANRNRRDAAAAALRYLASKVGSAAVVEVARGFEDAAAESVDALLRTESVVPKPVAKPGPWLMAGVLPQVTVNGGASTLPKTAVRHLLTALANIDPDDPGAETEAIRGACDADSLRDFTWALFEHWAGVGGPWSEKWAMSSLSLFGDDTTVRALMPLIHAWPGENRHHYAVAALQVLGRIGTEEALRAMQGIAMRAKFKAIKAEAGKQIAVIAAGLGLSREQLADRLVPTLGLDGDAALTLDYGPRRFTVRFDEHLKPYVTDENGKPRKALPKPGAKDDPEIATASYRRFTALKKELRTLAADQIRRLEAAMVNARTWSRDEFHHCFLDHPLMRHAARRLVWLAETGDTRFGFRFAEDGTLSDVADDTVAIPDDAVIRLAHPVHLTPAECEAWAQVLADYEVLQPFEQLSRTVMAFTDDELASGRLTRFEGRRVEPGHVLGLTGRGWVRGVPQDNGTEFGIHYPLPGGGFVAIGLDPGIQIGMGADNEEQTLEHVYLTDELDNYYFRGGGVPTCIDPVTASEVLASLDRITAAAA